jgi:pimeloyl-ACP methyl ester carboxylesterase
LATATGEDATDLESSPGIDSGADTAPASDTGDSDTAAPNDTADSGGPPASWIEYRAPGPYAVTTTEGTFHSSGGCDVEYTRYAPSGEDVGLRAVLSHGLAGEKAHMSVMAAHWATWGVDTTIPTQCNSSPLDIDQQAMAADMVELATHVGAVSSIHAGHSAGGLASFIAAADDERAVGWIGLDPVEYGTLATDHAASVPAGATLKAESGVCNLYNNWTAIEPLLPDVPARTITEAGHCDLSNPQDSICNLGCGTGTNFYFSEEELFEVALAMSTAAAAGFAGLDPRWMDWWEAGGEPYEELEGAGRVRE